MDPQQPRSFLLLYFTEPSLTGSTNFERVTMSTPLHHLLLAVLLLACPLMLAAPMDDGPPAWSSDFHSAPRAMDDVDLAILHSLRADLDGHPPPASDDAGSSVRHPESASSLAYQESLEPSSFNALPYHRALARDPPKLYFLDDPVTRARINELFGSHLHWVPTGRLTMSLHSYVSRSPLRRSSRELPLMPSIHGGGRGMRVHMTSHRSSRVMDGGPLEGKMHWAFWGVPEGEGSVVHYGTAWLEKRDYDGVDAHLRGVLERLEGRAHV